jgi:hypothetical protein
MGYKDDGRQGHRVSYMDEMTGFRCIITSLNTEIRIF